MYISLEIARLLVIGANRNQGGVFAACLEVNSGISNSRHQRNRYFDAVLKCKTNEVKKMGNGN